MSKEIKNFIVNYEDGTQRVIEKGFFCEMKDLPDGYCDINFIMTGVSGRDLKGIVMGCIQLGEELGMFENLGDNEE